MDKKVYIFGGLKEIEVPQDELASLEIYAINAQDYSPGGDNGRDPCGGAIPCTVPALT